MIIRKWWVSRVCGCGHGCLGPVGPAGQVRVRCLRLVSNVNCWPGQKIRSTGPGLAADPDVQKTQAFGAYLEEFCEERVGDAGVIEHKTKRLTFWCRALPKEEVEHDVFRSTL